MSLPKTLGNWVRRHQFVVYLASSTLFLLILNWWIIPTPDEYYYGVLAKAFTAASQGQIHWGDIDTEHTWLVPLLSFLYNTVIHPASLTASRYVIIPFALGTLAILYHIPRVIGIPQTQRMWWLWLLLAIPGFWIFSVRLMLEMPALFCFTLLCYLLLKRAPAYQTAGAMLLLLMVKEYYVYLTLPLVFLLYAVDAWWLPQRAWWYKLGTFFGKLWIVYFPVFVVVTILVDFNFLPYPRLVETSSKAIFGDLFAIANRTWLGFLHNISQITHHTATITPVTTETVPTGLSEKISSVQQTGKIPVEAFFHTAPIEKHSFFTKLWLIYQYNFSETDIHVLLLPLAVTGIGIRLVRMKELWNKGRALIRTDLFMFIFTGIFAFFNFHQADEMHGFRITIPIIVSLLYFTYYGLHRLLTQPTKMTVAVFMIATLISISGYWLTIRTVEYGSVLAHTGWLNTMLTYKPYLFMGWFVALACGIMYYHRITWTKKPYALLTIIAFIFVLKFFPFYLDARLHKQTYGQEYGLAGVTPVLQPIMAERIRLYSNNHPYDAQYFANDPFPATAGITPVIRRFKTIYPLLYQRFPLDDQFYSNMLSFHIDYVLMVNDDYDASEVVAFERLRDQHPTAFTLLADQYTAVDRLQWALYRFDPTKL